MAAADVQDGNAGRSDVGAEAEAVQRAKAVTWAEKALYKGYDDTPNIVWVEARSERFCNLIGTITCTRRRQRRTGVVAGARCSLGCMFPQSRCRTMMRTRMWARLLVMKIRCSRNALVSPG